MSWFEFLFYTKLQALCGCGCVCVMKTVYLLTCLTSLTCCSSNCESALIHTFVGVNPGLFEVFIPLKRENPLLNQFSILTIISCSPDPGLIYHLSQCFVAIRRKLLKTFLSWSQVVTYHFWLGAKPQEGRSYIISQIWHTSAEYLQKSYSKSELLQTYHKPHNEL